MTTDAQHDPFEIFNQPPALVDYNLYAEDTALREAVRREGGAQGEDTLQDFGRRMGSAAVLALGELANRNAPQLRSHDRFGNRIDEVEFHPAWHELMRLGIEAGLHSRPWSEPGPGAHVVRGALVMLRHQVEEGASCPLTMTFAVIPTLRLEPELAAAWEPVVLSREYDTRSVPMRDKRGAIFGMALTEPQGGSDVRANTTRARPAGNGEYLISGHKWFCSAPQADAFLVTAQAPGGLSCFLLPRIRPDGSRNAFHIQRLKDKTGNRSNASSEVEYREAMAWRVGPEGRGIANIMEMVRHTRLDCILGSAASLRRAVAEITHHAAHRDAFGSRLAAQPLMQAVLADLCLESEAATALALRVAGSYDRAASNAREQAFSRIVTAVAKYWVTKRTVSAAGEAMECIGGNGTIEESPLARLYRDAPINAIWEGSGNVQCLDVLRALARERDATPAILDELRLARGADRRLDALTTRLADRLARADQPQCEARILVEDLALALQASLLVRHAPSAVADGFCAARLAATRGLMPGTLPATVDCAAIVDRAMPRI